MFRNAQVARRLAATGAAMVLGASALLVTVGPVAATTNVDCPGMHVRLERAFPDQFNRMGFGVDDDVLITLNGATLLDDHDGLA